MSGIFKLFGLKSRVDETTKKRLQDELNNLYEEQNNQVKGLNEISKKIDEVKEKINNLPKSEVADKPVESPPESQDEIPKKDETQPTQEGEDKKDENNFLGINFQNPFAEKEKEKETETETETSDQQPTGDVLKPVAEQANVENPAQIAPLPQIPPPAIQPPAGLQSPPPNANGFAAPPMDQADAANFNTGFGESDELGGGKKNKNKKQKKTKSKTQSGGKKRRTRRNKKQKAVVSNTSSVSVEDI